MSDDKVKVDDCEQCTEAAKQPVKRPDTENDLEIPEDTADCADLSETEAEFSVDNKQSDEKKTRVKSVRIDLGPRSVASSEFEQTPEFGVSISRKSKDAVPSKGLDLDDEEKDIENLVVLRGKTNTPASMFTEFSELHKLDERPCHGVPESREATFQRAMTLMSERCISRGQAPTQRSQTPLVCVRHTAYGDYTSKYFYVNQNRPVPMPPLKAWRGYHGNVYFEPIHVNAATRSESCLDTAASLNRLASRATSFGPERSPPSDGATSAMHSISNMFPQGRNTKTSRASTTTSSKSAKSSKPLGPRQMSVLDKKHVFMKYNENIHEDIEWIKGQESTGSLCISPDSDKEERRKMMNKERIWKGSMAHRVYAEKKPCLPNPLAVSGDKFQELGTESAPLAKQNQYSHSPMRASLNAVDNHLWDRLDAYKTAGGVRFPTVDNRTHVIPSPDQGRYAHPQLSKTGAVKYSRNYQDINGNNVWPAVH